MIGGESDLRAFRAYIEPELLVCHLHATGDPRAAADFANRVAAISVEHTGASGIPTYAQVTARFG